jgi:hypothetical protein
MSHRIILNRNMEKRTMFISMQQMSGARGNFAWTCAVASAFSAPNTGAAAPPPPPAPPPAAPPPPAACAVISASRCI